MPGEEFGPAAMIARRAADRLREGSLWVYRSDVEQLIPALNVAEIEAGSLVTILDNRRIPLGSAIYSASSQIALRKVSDLPQLARNTYLEEMRSRVEAALALRTPMLEEGNTDSCRLIFSEADGLPGIVADKYDELVILQLLTQGTAQEDVREVLREVFVRVLKPAAIVERPDPRIRELEELAAPPSAALYARDAEPALATVFTLNGLRFHYDANSGQKTGAFLDQRLNYAAAARHAHGRALDICTYQGGFALHLAQHCNTVTGVDQSRGALEVAERNLDLNRTTLKAEVDWIEADAFELLRAYDTAGEKFDTIVLDPPAFAKSKRAAESAMRGYKEMNLRAMRMLNPGGKLITCSCSHHVALADFTATVAAAASDAKRHVRLLETRGAAPDHPEVLTLPETAYLKCLIAAVD
jgi:23S rRNA (cytosine1962-C5)-methyltransferase